MILGRGGIGRTADDISPRRLYRALVEMRLARLRRLRLDPVTVDRVLAVVLLVLAELEIWLTNDANGARVAAAIVAPAIAVAMAFRRRYPLLAGAGGHTVMATSFYAFNNTQIIATTIMWFCVLYGLTVWTTPRRFAFGAAYVAVLNLLPLSRSSGSSFLFGIVTLVVMLLVRWVLGDRERRVELAERERDVAAREAVVEERARIARELHDAIAHDVSMMVVQAGAERRVLDDNGSTRETLETIEHIGRGALTEMRRLVGMLRSADGDPLAPQPGLDDLPRLVAQVREAGLPVELEVEGERRELPVGIELSAYRIVQEALTNALKHAGEARATVRVRYGDDSLELEISDDGAGAAAPVEGGGHGLVGMRERVALYGGRRQDGGFAVRVLLPVR
jgi:signal transduction histidine kinase